MVSRISRLYGPKFNSDINSGLTNLATAFKPPSMQDVYLSQKMHADAATQLRKQAATERLSSGQGTLQDLFDAGVSDPIKGQNQLRLNQAAETGDYPTMDKYVYAGSQNYGNTAAGHFTTKLSPGETFMAPASIASLYGMRAPVPAADTAQPSGAATETDSKGQPSATGAFTYTAPEKSTDKLSTDAISAQWLKDHPDQIPAFIARGKGQTINVGGPQSGWVEGNNEALKNIRLAGGRADSNLADIATMRSAIESGGDNLTFGPASNFALSAKKFVGGIIGKDIPGVSEGDVINNLGYGLAAEAARAINQRGGTQAEFLRALESKPGLSQSRAGALANLYVMEQHRQSDKALAQHFADHPELQDPNKSLQAQNDFYAAHPIMSPFDPSRPLGAADVPEFEKRYGGNKLTLTAGTDAPAAPAAAAPAAAPIQVTPDMLKADPKTLSTEQLQAVVNAKRQAAPTLPPPGTPGVDVGPTAVPVSPLDYMRGGG